MSEGKISFTPEQEAAIKHRGSALLVSAAAGSGKTKVLVERLLDRVSDGGDIDEFLVITYTRAAASELRERIHDEILSRLADAPENRRLRRQSMLCRGAQIGTIHSFCTDILRENAHLAGLSPDFRVADESESDMIKAEVLEDCFDKAYETIGESDGFRALVDMISSGRDDRRLVGIILDAHSKLQSSPDPRAWAREQAEKFQMPFVNDVSETAWGALLMDKSRRLAEFRLQEMKNARAEMMIHPDFDAAYGAAFEAAISDIEAFLNALGDSWDEARRFSRIDFSREKPKRISGFDDLKDIRKRCKAAMDKCADIFACSSKEHIEDMRAVAPAMAALLGLVIDFDSAFAQEKRRRGAVDFSDLEHLTLNMLVDAETGKKTALAHSISQRFKEIMVDEYQDVNAVQEMIFNAVSQDGGNIFMVGDVKQSIYRFRLADPSIFLSKYRSFGKTGDGSVSQSFETQNRPLSYPNRPPVLHGSKILLSQNFRSRAGILDAVNYIFGKIMSEEFGEMDYTQREMLVCGRGDGNSELGTKDAAVEFDIIDVSALPQDEDEESPAKVQVEVRYIAERIERLIESGYSIPDGKGGSRRIEYSDIVILLRSVRDKAWQYAAALGELQIPVDMPGGEGFFESFEISAALSLLSIIDNPIQDIPLAAALSGPVYGFTADELADIRAGSRSTDFYGALLKAAESNEKCAAFLREIEALRVVMPDMPADRFIWHVYNKTGLPGRVGAMRGGDRRRNNLILLAGYARAFEQSGYKGLFGFLTYIRGLIERGTELAQDVAAREQNAVRIMSIHKSKGLEFPVVFLADTSKQFNNMDALQPLVLHQELGVGPMRTDRDRRIEYTTLSRMAIQRKLTSEMMAEELRVLYVAMTRAREKLIITAAVKDAEKEFEKLSRLSEGKIAPQVLEEAKSMAGWVMLAVCSGQSSGADSVRLTVSKSCGVIAVSVVAPGKTGDGSVSQSLETQNRPLSYRMLPTQASPDDVQLLHERFRYAYPFPDAPDLPSKLTVTGITKGRPNDMESAAFPGSEFNISDSRPNFVAKKSGLSASERGTALHLAMQFIDFKKCADLVGVETELRRLADGGFMTEEQALAVNAQKITRFLESDIGKRVRNADDLRREFKFSMLLPAEQFFPGGGEDKILFQGVIDCFFEEGGALVVVDFKTDNVTPETMEERAAHYAPQLEAYADALERITGKRVKERIIYFFAQDMFIIPIMDKHRE